MCRAVPPANFVIKVNENIQKQIRKAAPEDYKEQVAELRENN